VVWQSGNTQRQLEQLGELGIPVFHSEPGRLDDVAASLQRFGRLLGTESVAQAAAAGYRASIANLRARYAGRPPVRVFYQVWDKPIYTLSSKHIIDDAIRLCGGRNVFAGLKVVAPSVSTEAVLKENPEAIFGGDRHDADDAGIGIWKPYRGMLAVERGNLFRLEGELLTRPGPRMAQGAAQLCEKIELARQRRK
jgi:iron complex transport system substrate-binding protein